MTERVCRTCCWWNPDGLCELNPLTVSKPSHGRCRQHSFTTGWLEDEPSGDLDAKVKALSERCKEARQLIEKPWAPEERILLWLAGDDESPKYIDPKVKALSERCKEARQLIEADLISARGSYRGQLNQWLAGDDE